VKKHDHEPKKQDAEDKVLQANPKIAAHVFLSKVDDERASEDLGKVAACDEKGIASLGFVEIADVVDEAPEQEENDDLAPQFSSYKENGGDPIPVDRDPMGIFLSDFAQNPICRCVRGQGIEVWVEDKAVEEDEDHEKEEDPIKEGGSFEDIGEFRVEKDGAESNGKDDPAFENGDHFCARAFGGNDECVFHGGQHPVCKRDEEFHEKKREDFFQFV